MVFSTNYYKHSGSSMRVLCGILIFHWISFLWKTSDTKFELHKHYDIASTNANTCSLIRHGCNTQGYRHFWNSLPFSISQYMYHKIKLASWLDSILILHISEFYMKQTVVYYEFQAIFVVRKFNKCRFVNKMLDLGNLWTEY